VIARSIVAVDNSRIAGDENSGTTYVPLIVTCSEEANVQVKYMNVCVVFSVAVRSGGNSCMLLTHTIQLSKVVQFIKDFGIVTLQYPTAPESPEMLNFICD
jgi:hypothetical protein